MTRRRTRGTSTTSRTATYHEVWFPDATTMANRIKLAADRGVGIGFWRLGTEDQRTWGDPRLAPGTPWPN